MIQLMPPIFLLFGLVALFKPGWIEAIDRRHKAAGTGRLPSEIELDDAYHSVVKYAGVGFTLFGLLTTALTL